MEGRLASWFFAAIVALMTHLFSRFTAPGSGVYLPGAAFLAAAVLALGCLLVFWLSTREPVVEQGAAASESGLSAA